jgi:hypothetical protein
MDLPRRPRGGVPLRGRDRNRGRREVVAGRSSRGQDRNPSLPRPLRLVLRRVEYAKVNRKVWKKARAK